MEHAQQIVERYSQCRSFKKFEEYLAELKSDGSYKAVRKLRILYSYVKYKEERLLILKTLHFCSREKALIQTLIDFSYTNDNDELCVILDALYRHADPMAFARVLDVHKSSKSDKVKSRCIKILGQCGGEELADYLLPLFDSSSPNCAYETLRALLLIGAKVNIADIEERISKHRAGNLFLREHRFKLIFLQLNFHCASKNRIDVLKRYSQYPEGDIALLASTLLSFAETEEEQISSKKRKQEYDRKMILRLFDGALKQEDGKELNSADRYSLIYCKRHQISIKEEFKELLDERISSWGRYDKHIRSYFEHAAMLQIPYVNEYMWELFKRHDNKMLLAAVIDNIYSSDEGFIEEISTSLRQRFLSEDSKSIYSRIPHALVNLNKERTVKIIIDMIKDIASKNEEKEQLLVKELYNMLVYKSYFAKLNSKQEDALRSLFEKAFSGALCSSSLQSLAELAARLRFKDYEAYVVNIAKSYPGSRGLIRALMDLKSPAGESALLEIIYDNANINNYGGTLMNSALRYFVDATHHTAPPISVERLKELYDLMDDKKEVISLIGRFGLREYGQEFTNLLREGSPDYFSMLRIIEALGFMEETSALQPLLNMLYSNDSLLILRSAEAINRLKLSEGFEELLEFCRRSNLNEEMKNAVLQDINIVFNNALESIVKTGELIESARNPRYKRTLLKIRLQIDMTDRLKQLNVDFGQ